MATPLTLKPHVADRLRDNLIIWLSTVRPDGRPHLVPVWYLWDNETFLIFSKPDQKVRNLRANANVMVALDDTDRGEDVIMFAGVAELVNDITVPASAAYVAKYSAKLAEMKWTPESMAASYTQAIRITPTRYMGF